MPDIIGLEEMKELKRPQSLFKCLSNAIFWWRNQKHLLSLIKQGDPDVMQASEEDLAQGTKYRIDYSFSPNNILSPNSKKASLLIGNSSSVGTYKAIIYKLHLYKTKKSTLYVWVKQCHCESEVSRKEARDMAVNQITIMEAMEINITEFIPPEVIKLHGLYLKDT